MVRGGKNSSPSTPGSRVDGWGGGARHVSQTSRFTYETGANPPGFLNDAGNLRVRRAPCRSGPHSSTSPPEGAFLLEAKAAGASARPPARQGLGAAGRWGGAGRRRLRQDTEAARAAIRAATRTAARKERASARRAFYGAYGGPRGPRRASPSPPPSPQRPPAGLPFAGAGLPGLVPWALPGASPAQAAGPPPSARVCDTVRWGRAPRSAGSSSCRGETLQNGDRSGTCLPVSGRAA